MVSSEKDFEGISSNGKPKTYWGLHDDTKPADAINGACFIEMDAPKLYFYDQESGEWLEWGA